MRGVFQIKNYSFVHCREVYSFKKRDNLILVKSREMIPIKFIMKYIILSEIYFFGNGKIKSINTKKKQRRLTDLIINAAATFLTRGHLRSAKMVRRLPTSPTTMMSTVDTAAKVSSGCE